MGKKEILFSRGGLVKIKKILRGFGHKIVIYDERLSLPLVNFHSKITLRDEQVPPVEIMLKKKQGIVRGPCSSGKTVILLEAIARIGQPTTIILWSTDLQKQWKEEILNFFDITEDEIGGCGGIFKKPRLGNINICMQQSLLNKKNLDLFTEATGFVAGDEIQRYGAKTYHNTINEFPAKIRLGISANERRRDGKQFLIYDGFGKVIYEMDDEDVGSRKPARVICVPTKFKSEDYAVDSNHPAVITEMLNNKARNKILIKIIKRSLKKKKLCLVMTERREHAMFLRFYFKKYRTGLLIGDTSKKQLMECGWSNEWKKFITEMDNDAEFSRIKELAGKRKLDLIITTQKGFVGLSVKTIDHGFASTPTGINMELFNQQKGRVERDHDKKLKRKFGEKKTPKLFYLWDCKIEKFQKAGNRVMKKYPGSAILRLKKRKEKCNG